MCYVAVVRREGTSSCRYCLKQTGVRPLIVKRLTQMVNLSGECWKTLHFPNCSCARRIEPCSRAQRMQACSRSKFVFCAKSEYNRCRQALSIVPQHTFYTLSALNAHASVSQLRKRELKPRAIPTASLYIPTVGHETCLFGTHEVGRNQAIYRS